MHLHSISPPSSAQRGVALLASLLILMLVTVLGMSTMGSSSLQSKMVGANATRQQLFNAAEQTLAVVESQIANDLYQQTNFFLDDADNLFDASCTNGLCFFGSYDTGAPDHIDCNPSPAVVPTEPVWKDTSIGSGGVWTDNTRHQSEPVTGLTNPVKYIIEFLCYVDRSETELLNALNPNNGAEMYRITALAGDDFDRGQVILQSTYKHIID